MQQALSIQSAIKYSTGNLKYYRIFQSKFNTIHRTAVSIQQMVIQCNIIVNYKRA
jgi:hypothetical protein